IRYLLPIHFRSWPPGRRYRPSIEPSNSFSWVMLVAPDGLADGRISENGFLVKFGYISGMRRNPYSREQKLLQDLLKSIRESVPLTQAELARRLGRPQSFVSKYECGERRLDVKDCGRPRRRASS